MFFDKSHKGPYAMQGFGLDVPYSNAQGSTVMASAGTGTLCGTTGNAIALQAMLADLGFYKGTIDGIMGTGTRDAVKAFASSTSVDPGAYYATGAICQAIMDAYQAKHAPAPPLQPDGPPSPAPPQAKPVVRFLFNPAVFASAMAKKQAAAAPAASGGVMGWWGAQSSTMKIGLGVGVAAVLALGVYAAMGGGAKTATPNRAKPKPRCRSMAPKGYPKKRAAYALPECFMYPLNNKKRVRTAAARFGKHKRRYPPAVRGRIARRLDAAKKKFHIGEYHR